MATEVKSNRRGSEPFGSHPHVTLTTPGAHHRTPTIAWQASTAHFLGEYSPHLATPSQPLVISSGTPAHPTLCAQSLSVAWAALVQVIY
jgi:hypothetical protein